MHKRIVSRYTRWSRDLAVCVRADDVGTFFCAGEGVEGDEFGDGFGSAVEDAEDGDAGVGHADVGGYFEEDGVVVCVVGLCCFTHSMGAEDNRVAAWRLTCHLVDEVDVVLSGDVGDVDGAAGDAACGGVEGGVVVARLEHVPIGEYVEVLCYDGVVCVAEDMPGVAGGNLREEVIRVTQQHAWFVRG